MKSLLSQEGLVCIFWKAENRGVAPSSRRDQHATGMLRFTLFKSFCAPLKKKIFWAVFAFRITNSYAFGFLKYAEPLLSKEDLSQFLAYMWIHTEAPNSDPNLSKAKLVSMFKAADPTVMMDDEDYLQFKMLDDNLTVYRGVTSFNAKNIKALSWTLDPDRAFWFAHRFGEEGTVYEAQISKEHVYAFFGCRGESEVIVDPKHLTNITQVEEHGEGFAMNLQ